MQDEKIRTPEMISGIRIFCFRTGLLKMRVSIPAHARGIRSRTGNGDFDLA